MHYSVVYLGPVGKQIDQPPHSPTHYSTVGVFALSAQIGTCAFFAASVPTGLCLIWASTGQEHTTNLDKLVKRTPHEPY